MNAEAPVILQIKNLTKKFAAEGGKMLTACDNVTLNAYEGQTLGIIGESGCGKSTLMRAAAERWEAHYFADTSGKRRRSYF